MKIVNVNLSENSYKIIIEKDSFNNIYKHIKSLKLPNRGAIISNKKIFALYGEKILSNLKSNGFEIYPILIPDGETSKSLKQSEIIYHELLKLKMNRHTVLFALGGGVVGDLAGFIAATYLRGIPFVQLPTSLLSMVDSSVGGKVAVNLKEGKNLIGSFYQPKMVIIDPLVLNSLPKKEFINGMAEVIKYGLIMDQPFFNYLLSNYEKINSLNYEALEKVIYNSVKDKAYVVAKDEKEQNLRAILNFGHTFGHAIEKAYNYKTFTHGEAVAIGMHLACQLSLNKKYLLQSEFDKITPIFKYFNLNTGLKTNKRDLIYKSLFYDKKMTNKGLNFILIKSIGKVFQTMQVFEQDLKKIMQLPNLS